MIEFIRIKNFQIHKDLEILLDPRCNTIVGGSDNGKSAIIRALGWVLFNRPRGDLFRRSGTKKTSVTLKINEKEVTREKTASKNAYILEDLVLKAFSADVPDMVASHCAMTSANYQGQHEAPFWVSLTPGQLSKELNNLVNLEEIDQILQALNQKAREINQKRSQEQEKTRELKALRKSKAWSRRAFVRIDGVDSHFKALEELQARKRNLKHLIESWRDIAPLQESFGGLLRNFRGVERISSDLKTITASRTSLEVLINKASRVAYPTMPDPIKLKKLTGLILRIPKSLENARDLRRLIIKALEADKAHKEAQKVLQTCRGDWADFKKENPSCPLCGEVWRKRGKQ